MFLSEANISKNFQKEFPQMKDQPNLREAKMKKILFLASILLLSGSVFGNPVPGPHAIIIAFKFDTVSKWELEMVFELPFLRSNYDSISISTSAGSARVRLDFVKDSTTSLVITPDSLSIPLPVNSGGDCIILTSYMSKYGMSLMDVAVFGNYPGAMCDSIPEGYSIRRFSYYYSAEYNGYFFCLSKNPTIGASYDTSGCCATITGTMFDKNYKKVISGNFMLDFPVTFNSDSTYSLRIYAMRYGLYALREEIAGGWEWVGIDSLSIDAFPDSIIRKDVHFINLVGIKQNPLPSNPDLYIINYPDPFNPGTNFYVRIPTSLERKVGRIDIYNSIGQKVFVVPISNSSSYKWNGVDMSGKAVASGVYYYRLVFDNAVYKNGSMILLK